MLITTVRALAAFAITMGLGVAGAGAAAADSALPVPWTTAAAAAAVLADPNGDPAGSNDWSCRPSTAHPRPVVLVHGLTATKTSNWTTFAPLLHNKGYCVFALTYGGIGLPQSAGYTRMESSAVELQHFVDRVLVATGASQVDLVGHSEGTVMPLYYLKHLGGKPKVRNFVALTPIYHGTTLAGLGTLVTIGKTLAPQVAGPISDAVDHQCGSCQEFLVGSAYLRDVGGAVDTVRFTTVMTRYDELVTPYTSGYLDRPNARNVVLQDGCLADGADHLAVAFDPRAAQITLNALDPAHARPLPCVPVLPLVGAPVAPAL